MFSQFSQNKQLIAITAIFGDKDSDPSVDGLDSTPKEATALYGTVEVESGSWQIETKIVLQRRASSLCLKETAAKQHSQSLSVSPLNSQQLPTVSALPTLPKFPTLPTFPTLSALSQSLSVSLNTLSLPAPRGSYLLCFSQMPDSRMMLLLMTVP